MKKFIGSLLLLSVLINPVRVFAENEKENSNTSSNIETREIEDRESNYANEDKNGLIKERYGHKFYINGKYVIDRWIEIDGKFHFFDRSGYMQKNKWLNLGGKWYFVSADGARFENGIHTIPLNNRRAFFKNGVCVINAWASDETGTYFLGLDGYAITNDWMRTPNGKWSFMDTDGKRVENGFFTVKYGKKSFFKNGIMVESSWVTDNGNYYFIDNYGYLLTNQWLNQNGKWYYLTENGERVENGWYNIGGKFAYFENGISIANDWRRMDDGKHYFINSDHYARTEGWIKDDNNSYYYLKKDGSYLKDTLIDGYYVGFNGERFDLSKNKILNVPKLSQIKPDFLPMGCEGTAFAMAIKYKGVNGYSPKDINSRFPITQDPRTGFIGSPFSEKLVQGSTPTIWPKALMKHTADIYDNVVDLTGSDLSTLLKEINNGNPVVYWFSYPLGVMINVNTPNGIIVNSTSMHCVTLVGYDSKYLYYNDPVTNNLEKLEIKEFYDAYIKYGRMAIAVR